MMERQEKDRLQDFDWALGINRFSLRLLGIWSVDQDENFKSIWRIPLMILVMIFGMFLPQMYALTLVMGHLPLVIDNILISGPLFTSNIKLLLLMGSKRVLQPVVASALQDYLRPKPKREELVMRREASRGRLITIVDYSIMAVCYLSMIVMPVLGISVRIVNNITDYGGRHPLIVQSYYPFDYSKSPAYELTHLMQMLASFFACIAISIPDDYFCALILHVSAQFEILGLQIETLGMDKDKERIDDGKLLRGFIYRHLHLNRMVTAMEKSFEFVIAMQIFYMSIAVCCLGVQVLQMLSNTAGKPTPIQIMSLGGNFIGMLIHTFINCLVSENLESRSSEVLFKIYNSRWYVLPCSKLRCLIPMMLVAKTPRQIRVAKIMPMSLASYCSIVKSTAGYISMLIAVSGRPS